MPQQRNWTKITLWGLLGLGSTLFIYKKRGSISKYIYNNIWLSLSLSAEDYKQYDRLLRIEKAYLNNLAYFNSIKGDSTGFKTKLGALSVDNDHIFSRLDEVRGGELIKTFRKEIVDKLNKLSEEIDALAKDAVDSSV